MEQVLAFQHPHHFPRDELLDADCALHLGLPDLHLLDLGDIPEPVQLSLQLFLLELHHPGLLQHQLMKRTSTHPKDGALLWCLLTRVPRVHDILILILPVNKVQVVLPPLIHLHLPVHPSDNYYGLLTQGIDIKSLFDRPGSFGWSSTSGSSW